MSEERIKRPTESGAAAGKELLEEQKGEADAGEEKAQGQEEQ